MSFFGPLFFSLYPSLLSSRPRTPAPGRLIDLSTLQSRDVLSRIGKKKKITPCLACGWAFLIYDYYTFQSAMRSDDYSFTTGSNFFLRLGPLKYENLVFITLFRFDEKSMREEFENYYFFFWALKFENTAESRSNFYRYPLWFRIGSTTINLDDS